MFGRMDLIIAGLIFALVLAVWVLAMGVVAVRRAGRNRRVQERIGLAEFKNGNTRVLRLWHEGRQAVTVVPALAWRSRLAKGLEQFAKQTNWGIPARTLLLGLGGVLAMVFVVSLALMKSMLLAVLMAVAVLVVLSTMGKQYVAKQTARFERQFVDALDLAARSLRAGHPLLGAFRLVSEELGPPVSAIFAAICQQQAMGLSLEQAMRRVAEESTSPDMRLFTTSVAIQLRSGGNLADMMDRLAFVIRERIRLGRRVKVLTAQTQFSKRVLLALPFLLFVALNIISPDYVRPLYATAPGKILLAVGAAGLLAGGWVMNRMAAIKW